MKTTKKSKLKAITPNPPANKDEVYIEWAAHVIAYRAVFGINNEVSFRTEGLALAAFQRAKTIIRELRCI